MSCHEASIKFLSIFLLKQEAKRVENRHFSVKILPLMYVEEVMVEPEEDAEEDGGAGWDNPPSLLPPVNTKFSL
jgi:hypothetical protein